ncbi:MAG: glycogen/starch synthase, partial [Patescibacteria group bacterium]
FLKKSAWKPDVFVAAVWQRVFLPNLLKTVYSRDSDLSKIATVFSIHNISFQAMFDHRFVPEMDFDAGQQPVADFDDPRLLKLNGMRRGIMYADAINTVSPTYSQEILTAEFGEKLNELLKERRGRLFGILNGVDYEILNPETDPHVKANYSGKNFIKNRAINKLALQKQFGLAEDKDKFLIGIVSRMDRQKGFDLIIEAADALFANIDFQRVIVGGGDNKYRLFFQELEKKYPKKVAGHFFFDSVMPRMIFAGADAILMPSRFEPCGLVQMEAMRYGAVPIARKIGGLADSILDFDPERQTGTGFLFENFDPYALFVAIVRAKEAFRNKKEWSGLIGRAMSRDFSWQRSAEEYLKLFSLALKLKQEENK